MDCTVLIIDSEITERSCKIRDELHRRRIPAAVALTSERFSLNKAFVNILFDDTLYGSLGKFGITDRESILYSDCRAVADTSDHEAEIYRLCERVCDLLYVKYGINTDSFLSEGYSDFGGMTHSSGRRIILTDTERLIIKHLASRGGIWCSAREIILFCLEASEASRAVAVHISRINKKFMRSSVIKMIETKYGTGYRFNFRQGENKTAEKQ